MGCDIHLYIEFKEDQLYIDPTDNLIKKKKVWIIGNSFMKNPSYLKNNFFDDNEMKVIKEEYADENLVSEFICEKIDINRDYRLFGELAAVRYSDTIPVAQPKGFPDDASEDVKKEFDRWSGDAHTPSYLTLKELKEYMKNRQTTGVSVQFTKIISILTERAGEVFNLWRTLETGTYNTEDGIDETIRIVFWFDN